jgi:hypothetical protein
MSLATLIKRGSLRHLATAIPATAATDAGTHGPPVATIATVAVATAPDWAANDPEPSSQDLAHARLIDMGLDDPEAAKLAEWMVLRQEHGEDQIVCYECKHFRPNRKRCGNHIKAEMPQEMGTDLATKPQRCPGFADLPQRFTSS